MIDWNDIQAQTPRTLQKDYPAKAPESFAAGDDASPSLSRAFILRFVAGVMVMLGLRAEETFGRRAHLFDMSGYMFDIDGKLGGFQIRRPIIPNLKAWAAGPSISVRVQSRNLWLSSKAINNSPDPNIRRRGHDAWATRRPYPRVPGLEPGFPSTLVERRRGIPDICCANSGTTAPAGGVKIVIAPP